jgi:tetratricopeptide (TPR) repeat protein
MDFTEYSKKVSGNIAAHILKDKTSFPLLSPDLEKERIQLKYEKTFENYFKKIEKGSYLLAIRHTELSRKLPDIFKAELIEELSHIGQEDRSEEELWGLSQTAFASFVSVGIHYYNEEEYEEAAEVFCLLVTICPTLPFLVTFYGHAEYKNSRYDQALLAYGAVAQVEKTDPSLHFYMAHCYDRKALYDDALASLIMAHEIISKNPDMSAWSDKVLDFMNYLKRRRVE